MDNRASEFASALAAQLRAERAARQMTMKDVAVASGLADSTVHRYLNGKRDIPVSHLFSMASVLQVDVECLVSRTMERLQDLQRGDLKGDR